MTEWNKDLEKKILRKSSYALTFRVIRVMLACLLIYAAWNILLNITVDRLHLGEKNTYYTKLAIEWTNPNVTSDLDNRGSKGVTGLLTQNIHYPLVKVVGRGEKIIGEADIQKKITNSWSLMHLDLGFDNEENRFHFYLPEHPITKETLTITEHEEVWSTLDKLSEGTVAEFAFSTASFMTPEELLALLAPYDLDVLWLPLYMGEFVAFQPNGIGSNGNSDISLSYNYGLVGSRETDEDYLSGSKYTKLNGTLENSKITMIENMKALLDEKKSYYENFLGLYNLKERYQFLKDEGFIVYGAVVTGPVKELLKLKEVEEIHGERLGEIDFWNWNE